MAALCVAGAAHAAAAPVHATAKPHHARHKTASLALTPDAEALVQWVVDAHDNAGAPFGVIDKQAARLWVYDGSGQLKGAAPVLIGKARGDDTAPGIGEKPLSEVKESEKTTPAGRFVAEHGENLRKEHVIWVDYDDAVSMHPVLTTNPAERRLQRLASKNPSEHRISFGCINVPKTFFQSTVLGTLDAPHPVIYILPETRPLSATFVGWYPVGQDALRREAAQIRQMFAGH
jgi:hypothetical protein